MTTLTNEHEYLTTTDFRAAMVLLDWCFFEDNYPDRTKNDLVDWAGLIPDFFLHALQETQADDVQAVAEGMDEIYGFGALGYPFKDTRMVPGSYFSVTDSGPVLRHPDDEDIKPIVSVSYGGRRVKCVVYPYGLVGLINSRGDQIVFRMD